jgi:hypothetical protein
MHTYIIFFALGPFWGRRLPNVGMTVACPPPTQLKEIPPSPGKQPRRTSRDQVATGPTLHERGAYKGSQPYDPTVSDHWGHLAFGSKFMIVCGRDVGTFGRK